MEQHFFSVSQSLYLAAIIQNFNDLNEGKEGARWEIAKVCITIVLLATLSKNIKNIFNYLTLLISLRVRVCLTEMIYRKVLKLSNNMPRIQILTFRFIQALRLNRSGLAKTSTGQIINHITMDMNRIDTFWKLLPYPVVSFALMIYVMASLWKTLAHFTFYGLAFLLVVIPIQSYIGKIFSSMRLKAAADTDERLRLVNEFLNAINIIKLYCWWVLG